MMRDTQGRCYGDRMASATSAAGAVRARRRELQKQQTRLDLALAAFDLAREHGVAGVRIPEIAAAVGVSPRTFNNYFPSKEAAIAWPTTLRIARLAATLAGRPAEEPLADAIVTTVAGQYGTGEIDGLPAGWLDQFRALVAVEPALHGEYLKAAAAAETALADAIARREGAPAGQLESLVLAAAAVAAERAAVLHWARTPGPRPSLTDAARVAVAMAVGCMTGPAPVMQGRVTSGTRAAAPRPGRG
jgi:AcrR family transcriptional regulator